MWKMSNNNLNLAAVPGGSTFKLEDGRLDYLGVTGCAIVEVNVNGVNYPFILRAGLYLWYSNNLGYQWKGYNDSVDRVIRYPQYFQNDGFAFLPVDF
jgi:hypothetical protein